MLLAILGTYFATNTFDIMEAAALKPFQAVSYTHLRAHETVLDLVCRLLLEKKNKSIYTIS